MKASRVRQRQHQDQLWDLMLQEMNRIANGQCRLVKQTHMADGDSREAVNNGPTGYTELYKRRVNSTSITTYYWISVCVCVPAVASV